MSALPPIVQKVLADKQEIIKTCQQLADQLNTFYKDTPQPVVFIGILKGCQPFMAYLLSYVNFLCEIEYIEVQSFLGQSKAMQEPVISHDMITTDLKGRDVVLVDDIIDSNASIKVARNYINQQKPHSIKVVALVTRQDNIPAKAIFDWVGLKLPNDFLVGFGLDYMGCYRNLEYIAIANMDYIAQSQQTPNTFTSKKNQ